MEVRRPVLRWHGGKISEMLIGAAGEHVVCADLLSQGVSAFMAAAGCPYDVVAQLDTRLFRIQVKTTAVFKPYLQRDQRHVMGYSWGIRQGKNGRREYTEQHFDVLALVALDCRKVAYFQLSEVRQTMQIPVSGHRSIEGIKRFENFPFSRLIL